MCSKHVEAWNKLIVKQKFYASSWLITEINILRCTVSKTSKFVQNVSHIDCRRDCCCGVKFQVDFLSHVLCTQQSITLELSAISQAVSHWSVTSEFPVKSRTSLQWIRGGQSGNGQVLLWVQSDPSLSVSLHQCPIFIFIFMLLWSEKQAGQAREHSSDMLVFRKL